MILKEISLEEDLKKLPREITEDELKNGYQHFLTVGQLREKLKGYPDEAKVLVQRIEDVYYEKHQWGVVFKESEFTWQSREDNRKLTDGTYANKDQYPKLDVNKFRVMTERELRIYDSQYSPVWCVVDYEWKEEKKKNLYLDLHY